MLFQVKVNEFGRSVVSQFKKNISAGQAFLPVRQECLTYREPN